MTLSVVELLRDLIRIPSVNPDGVAGTTEVGEKKCAEYLHRFLTDLGASAEYREVLPDRPNVIARFPADRPGKPRLLLAPHTDTVSVAGMTIDPFAAEVRDGKVWGRGASDTKGPMAAILFALHQCREILPRLSHEIWFAGLMSEEAGQFGSAALASQEVFDLVIVGEPTELQTVYTHKGAVNLTLRTRGRAAHSSTPQDGDNAIEKMLDVLSFFREKAATDFVSHRDTILDFAVIATVVVVAETVGLIPASAAGIGLAIVLFIRDQIRGSVLRSRATLASISSKTRRLEQERAEIAAHGEEAEAVALQGNLFFGTTDQLFTELERDLARRTWLLLDMRRVQSLDYTAANLFRQMHLRLEERGGGLLLCGLPARLTRRQDIQGYLARIGLVGDHGAVRVFETRDSALEWMEDRILERAGLGSAAGDEPLDLGETALFADLDSDALAELRACIEERAVAAGQAVFRRGDVGDEIFILRQGSVRILLPLPGGAQHHIATFGRGDFFGDMAFLDRGTRSADAIANGDCALYVLSRAEFDRRAADRPALAAMVFARLARVASERLRQADAELTAVEDR